MIQAFIVNYIREFSFKNLAIIVLSLAIIPFFVSSSFSQDSELEKSVYKNNNKKKKATPKKNVKKSTPKKSTTKKPASKPASTKKRSTKRTRKNTAKRNSRSVLVTFETAAPKQEVWTGNRKLGTTDDTAQLEKWMLRGNYIVSVKDDKGDVLLKSMLINVSSKNTEFRLVKEEPKEEPEKEAASTAEEDLNNELKDAVDAADKVNDILARYVDPLKTGTVTLTDWEYVLEKAQTNSLKNFTAVQIEAQKWFSSGQIEFSKGNYKNAYAAFVKTSEIIPDSAYPYYALGNAYLSNKQISDATIAFQRTLQLNPAFSLAHRKLGDIYSANKKHKDAIKYYKLAIQNGFNTPAVRYDLARSYMEEERWDDASKELESVVNEAPTSDVYIALGDLYAELKRNISAYEAYVKATDISPNSAKAYYKLGDILFNAKEYERSKKAFEEALKLDSKGNQINVSLARKFVREAAEKLK